MLLNEDIRWMMLEGYLSTLFELNVSKIRSREVLEKWNSVQLFIMNLFADGNLLTLDPPMFLKIGKAFPIAVKEVLGSEENITSINVPIVSIRDKEKITELWGQVPDEEKSKVYALYYIIKNAIGA